MRTSTLSLFALALTACGPRTNHVRSAVESTQATTTTATTSTPSAELPTGDPKLKNAAVALGKAPPELEVNEWVGLAEGEQAVHLAALVGRPVLVQFCTLRDDACARSRVVVRDLFDRYRKYGFTVVEIFVDEPGPRVTSWDFWAQERKDIGALQLPWAAGFGERTTYTKLRWGIASTPAAYLLDADGALVWSGDPNKNPSLANAVDTIAGRAP